MTKYAQVSEEGLIIQFVEHNPPLTAKEIPMLRNGKPAIRIVAVQKPNLTPEQRIADGPTYVVTDTVVDEVYKAESIPTISPDENAKQARANALPTREVELEILWRIVAALVNGTPIAKPDQVRMTAMMKVRAENPLS